jgi:hypothetical protein
MQADALTFCPTCGGQMRVGDCAMAPSPSLEVRNWRTEEEREQAVRSWKEAQNLKWVVVLTVLTALIAGGLFWRMRGSSNPVDVYQQATDSQVELERRESKQIFAIAKAAVEAPNWEEMRAHVLDPDRVKPLMDWYYRSHPSGYQVRTVTGYDQEIVDLKHVPATATLRLLTNTGLLHLLLQQTPEGWKIDWESYSSVYSAFWSALVKGDKGLPEGIPIPVEIDLCAPSTLLPSWFAATGFPREDAARAVRIYVAHPTNVAAACWSATDAVGQEILEARTKAGKPLRWVLQVALRSAATFPPAVEVKGIVKRSWDNPEQPHPDDP